MYQIQDEGMMQNSYYEDDHIINDYGYGYSLKFDCRILIINLIIRPLFGPFFDFFQRLLKLFYYQFLLKKMKTMA